ncbi:uncharacterized protein J3R85_018136 [Psidium guajava]|nr:uncharacterized protein J3R85_018136 [Psidium guajava]
MPSNWPLISAICTRLQQVRPIGLNHVAPGQLPSISNETCGRIIEPFRIKRLWTNSTSHKSREQIRRRAFELQPGISGDQFTMDPSTGRVIHDKSAMGAEQVSVVDTIDYRSSAWQGQEQRNVQIIHQARPKGDNPTSSGGLLAGAAVSVASTLESAKDVIVGK